MLAYVGVGDSGGRAGLSDCMCGNVLYNKGLIENRCSLMEHDVYIYPLSTGISVTFWGKNVAFIPYSIAQHSIEYISSSMVSLTKRHPEDADGASAEEFSGDEGCRKGIKKQPAMAPVVLAAGVEAVV